MQSDASKQPLSVHILTSHKNRNRQVSILETWLSNFSDYVFYTDFTTDVGNQVELTTNDGYDSGGEKHILEVNRIVRENLTSKYEWFYFCDDDTVPNLGKIVQFSKTADVTKVHGFWDYAWAEDRSLHSLSGGSGYLVHSSIFANRTPPKLKRIVWGDVQFSLWLRENGIGIEHTDLFKHNVPSVFGIDMNTVDGRNAIRDHMSFHYVKDLSLMSALNEIYNSSNE